jgi:hypothetical protein
LIMALMTQAEFAAHRGVGKSAVSNWKKAGLLVFAEGPDGKLAVDVARTDAKLNARIDPTRGRPTTAIGETGVPSELALDVDTSSPAVRNAAAVRVEVAEEELVSRRMKNAEVARQLVPMVEVERRLGNLGRMARERVEAELRGRAEQIAAQRDPRSVMMLMVEACDTAFNALADAIERGALTRDDEDEAEPEAEAA